MTMMTVDDLARDLKVKNEDLLRELVGLGYEVEGPDSPLETDDPAALRARLIDAFPQREVVEKRIKPTVIRRRVKPNAQMSADEIEPTAAHETEPFEQPERKSTQTEKPDMRETLRKPVKKVRRPEPARIIEMAPRQAEQSAEEQADLEPRSPGLETELPPVTPESARKRPETAKRKEPAVTPVESGADREQEDVTDAAPGQMIHIAERHPVATPPSEAGASPVSADSGTAEVGKSPEPHETDERKPFDPRKRKKRDKRMQPAQIIGKIELKKEVPREAPVEAPREERPRPQPQRTFEPRPSDRPGRPGDRPAGAPDRPGYARPSPSGAPPRRPLDRKPETIAFIPELSEEKKREKKKKEQKRYGDVETRVDDDKGVAKKRKEVILRNELFDERHRGGKLKGRKKPKQRSTEITTPKAIKRRIKVPTQISVSGLAHKMSVKASQVIHRLLGLGVTASMNETVDYETAAVLATDFGFETETAEQAETDFLPTAALDTQEDLISRPPVVTVMGHVDHGKTSLLDRIRSTHVTDQEAGGITQHIGAYKVKLDRGEVVFLDTPGHEAFTAMRARGAQVTDLVILVVAADDGVMDQTVEAINHARAAKVPILVAVNKIDKPEADKDKVLRELSEHGLIPEDWGGDTLFAYVSAKTGQGIDEFLDLLLLQAEMLELQANPDKKAVGTIVEARLDKGKGAVATVLIREGTLKLGDAFIAGLNNGKVRAMLDYEGRSVEEAGPATPVEVQGFTGVPDAGELFMVVEDDKVARQIVTYRSEKQREQDAASTSPMSLENLLAKMAEQPVKELNLIVKADVQGSVEALKEALAGVSAQEIKVKTIHGGVGAIIESDVMLASASNAIIIGFNVRPTPKTVQLAEQEGVDIRLYSIIYEALEDVRKAMEGMLAPVEKETVMGRAEVRQIFHVPKIGTIAGCHVVSGKIERSNHVRLIRDNVVVYTGRMVSMKRYKDDIKEAVEGYECGIALENFRDVKLADVIEAYIIEREVAKLTEI